MFPIYLNFKINWKKLYENDEKDPYGYKKYDRIYIKCLKQIPAIKFKEGLQL